ncbi:C-terminal processing peptidase-3. Serine peptidase. MEROPS family S41A [Mucilaginibacter gossypiicola]|uniref:C-terminal processing peptidase-3. Serine peptidase. MEROPS family S41A n=1 Tax=Mucilaginibacter gossypiicola TaxID=551995 RepID=A0A1H8QVB4_9SPHI|nr:S41 family peptidase [Mucilaginibacter gossypiicola]SEO58230.1 C-terminal processing peptidase-3. Serine peptidase. MEROPS family S41A [Mucilaginibacter gossypiicola]
MKRTAGVIFRTMILLFLGIMIGLLLNRDFATHNLGLSFTANSKIAKVLQLVDRNYVDSVNIDSIEGVSVNNLLQNLDPHSLYLPKQQAQSINERLDGGFNGIGIEYQLLRDTLIITQVYAGGPAEKAGLLVGSKVINVDDKKFSGSKLTAIRINGVFRGEKDAEIKLTVIPPLDKDLKILTVKRGHVDLSSVDAAYMADATTGYIKISKFSATTDVDFRKALTVLKTDGMNKLLLDLRGNGGGYLNAATSLADEFLTEGKLIVYTKGIHEPRTDYFATDSGMFQKGKVTVLIDEYSASASEILAGALQDLDRATIVGRRSFGKGLVQQQFAFDDGSAVNLTVARYYTPSGRSIQKSYRNGVDSYRNELAQRMQKGELFSEQSNLNDSIFKGTPSYHTSSGRKVFSGGGIMPDVFVPADTSKFTPLIQDLSQQQLFTAYVIDRQQQLLKKYPTEAEFLKQYAVSNDDVDKFILYASQTIKEMDSNEIRNSREPIKTILKAQAARFKWGDNAYFKVINADDVAFKKGLEQ